MEYEIRNFNYWYVHVNIVTQHCTHFSFLAAVIYSTPQSYVSTTAKSKLNKLMFFWKVKSIEVKKWYVSIQFQRIQMTCLCFLGNRTPITWLLRRCNRNPIKVWKFFIFAHDLYHIKGEIAIFLELLLWHLSWCNRDTSSWLLLARINWLDSRFLSFNIYYSDMNFNAKKYHPPSY